MTQQEWIKKFSQELKHAKDKRAKLKEIQQTIDNLIYSTNKQPVSNDYKLKIWEGVEKELKAVQKSFSVIDSAYGREGGLIHEATDNSEILKLMGEIEGKLRG